MKPRIWTRSMSKLRSKPLKKTKLRKMSKSRIEVEVKVKCLSVASNGS